MDEDFKMWLANNPSGFDHHNPDHNLDEDSGSESDS